MKSYVQPKAKPAGRMNPQQATYELKHRVVVALNKLADRDTHQIGVDELEKIAQGLAPEGIAPFLSCVVDTDSEQKSGVRKECIKVMATLARFHGDLLAPHIGKMVASVVKRLKDQDSVVRDACVETVGVLSLMVKGCEGVESGGGSFAVLARPLFESLGEQNKQVQSGSAMCLTRVVDSASDVPVQLLGRMLNRILKLLKSQHFMAKSALVELVRSIIQAGGTSLENLLLAALAGIQEALKNSDWTTRKAAAVALISLTTTCGKLLGPFKESCIQELESRRFDKVKPVRDSITLAIQYWKNLPGFGSPEPSEAGSSTKENLRVGGGSVREREGDWYDNSLVRSGSPIALKKTPLLTKKRSPLSVRKACVNHAEDSQHYRSNDWNVEIAVAKTRKDCLNLAHNDESDGSFVTKNLKGTVSEATESPDVGCESIIVDEKLESSILSDIATDHFENNFCAGDGHSDAQKGDIHMTIGKNTVYSAEKNYFYCPMSMSRTQERSSLDSTVTEVRMQAENSCCAVSSRELTEIKKQLLDIEGRQSSLMNLLQAFMESSLDALSTLQTKVISLEQAMDKISGSFTPTNHSNSVECRKGIYSPRLSTCTPRRSIDSSHRKSSASTTSRDMWDECTNLNSRSGISVKHASSSWRETGLNIRKPPAPKGTERHGNIRSMRPFSTKVVSPSTSLSYDNSYMEHNGNNLWRHVKEYLCAGDYESAFVEVLHCRNNHLSIIGLMDRTGPVLERLSPRTSNELLSVITSDFLDQRFIDSSLPWLYQVIQLSIDENRNCLGLTPKLKKNVLFSLQNALSAGILAEMEKRSLSQIELKLRQIWGK